MCPQLCKDSPTQSLIDCNSPPVSSPFLIEKVAYLLQGKGSNLPAVISWLVGHTTVQVINTSAHLMQLLAN